jgi:hypothetical protein
MAVKLHYQRFRTSSGRSTQGPWESSDGQIDTGRAVLDSDVCARRSGGRERASHSQRRIDILWLIRILRLVRLLELGQRGHLLGLVELELVVQCAFSERADAERSRAANLQPYSDVRLLAVERRVATRGAGRCGRRQRIVQLPFG